MGWFFKEKKSGSLSGMDEKTLRFPTSAPPERIIEPEKVKEAVGVARPITPVEFKINDQEMPAAPQPEPWAGEPLYIKVDVYQRILGEFESLRKEMNHLKGTSGALEKSEFNEENYFEKLKKDVRLLHDRLLQVDQILFKT